MLGSLADKLSGLQRFCLSFEFLSLREQKNLTTMKKIIFTAITAFLFIAISNVDAQIKTPALSPSSTIMQTVGMTDFTVKYSRPAMRGRDIFGALVPYGEVWRTGANAATKVTISDDITVEGKELKKGDYAMFSKPGMTSWEIHFFPYTTSSAGGYGDATAAVVATVKPMKSAKALENFQISFIDMKNESATMCLAWANTVVPVKLGVGAHASAMKSIERTLAGPSNGDYFSAGMYMANNNEDIEKAISYIRKATESDDPKFWQLKQESELMAKLGRMPEAIAKAKKSLALATKADNKNYIRMNTENITAWTNK